MRIVTPTARPAAGRRQRKIVERPEKAEAERSLPAETLLKPAEVAALFRVDPKTVTRWAKAGKLNYFRTLGGHRRYRQTDVQALLAAIPTQRNGEPALERAEPGRRKKG